jgi:Cu+-exporting ATPase
MTIAFLSAGYWMFFDVEKAFTVFTAVLIITCPCAFALAAPFTLSAGMKELSRIGFYIKNTGIIEKIKNIQTVVFDKTGTLTGHETKVSYTGDALSNEDKQLVYDAVSQSIHPLSVSIAKYLKLKNDRVNQIHFFEEVKGEGIIASFSTGDLIKLGSKKLVGITHHFISENAMSSLVHLSINNHYKGTFELANQLRPFAEQNIREIQLSKKAVLLSGDNDSTKIYFESIFPANAALMFNQTPEDKLLFIQSLQSKNEKVMMIGDGLNDSGALKQSDVGISLTEKTNAFSPAADVIMEAANFKYLPSIFQFSTSTIQTIRYAFLMSFLYNLVGLFFAVQGLLDPIYCAVLMPVSSISVVIFTTFMTKLRAKQYFKA